MYAISACSPWKGPLKLYNVSQIMLCFFLTNRVQRGKVSHSKNSFFQVYYKYLQKQCLLYNKFLALFTKVFVILLVGKKNFLVWHYAL